MKKYTPHLMTFAKSKIIFQLFPIPVNKDLSDKEVELEFTDRDGLTFRALTIEVVREVHDQTSESEN